jgi:acetyl esterase/lipase
LWAKGAPDAVGGSAEDTPTVAVHRPAEGKANGASVIVCPGGGYHGLAITYEGHEVADWLNTAGITAFVLTYRVAPRYHYPAPQQDAQRAIRTVRARAKEWGLDPNHIGILGFSAGGHLAGSTGVIESQGNPQSDDSIERVSAKPNFMVLVYPVISMVAPYAHAGSRTNLLGPKPGPGLVRKMSLELQVTKDTPPTFLVHTTEDEIVPVANPVAFYEALVHENVAAEIHIFQQGKHGRGLGTKDPGLPFGAWPELCLKWLHVQGVI